MRFTVPPEVFDGCPGTLGSTLDHDLQMKQLEGSPVTMDETVLDFLVDAAQRSVAGEGMLE